MNRSVTVVFLSFTSIFFAFSQAVIKDTINLGDPRDSKFISTPLIMSGSFNYYTIQITLFGDSIIYYTNRPKVVVTIGSRNYTILDCPLQCGATGPFTTTDTSFNASYSITYTTYQSGLQSPVAIQYAKRFSDPNNAQEYDIWFNYPSPYKKKDWWESNNNKSCAWCGIATEMGFVLFTGGSEMGYQTL